MTVATLLMIAALSEWLANTLNLQVYGLSSLPLALLLAMMTPERFASHRLRRWQPWLLKGGIMLFGVRWVNPHSWSVLLELLLAGLLVLMVTLLAGLVIGRLLGINRPQTALLSIGFAVCGGSAIAAATPVAHHHPHFRAAFAPQAISLIALFGLANLMLYPLLVDYLGSDRTAVVAGLSTPELAQAMIASTGLTAEAGQLVLISKLGRVFLLGLALAVIGRHLYGGHTAAANGGNSLALTLRRYSFLWGFALLAVAHVQHWLSDNQAELLAGAGHILMLLAVTLLGLHIRLADVMRLRPAVVLLATLLWLVNLVAALIFSLPLSL
ncbi:putative sulfate exporter family transporter [Bacterioplanoides pacificum]|uniref:Sulfate exporter family transporter n=1 Tax=Bacterioplanoides pacificum TaxID=1171596 RepID=A0ABV7VR53_9GAMM